ncbi:hypothetical protein Amsp01_041040 [Amycolatopsis sp. NBRC 101858]|nr:hypothetical protein Amsp01_041040 [Amycolatopsis sp. NBRC 101858]
MRVPDGVDPAAIASASDNLTDAYRSVLSGQRHASGAPLLVVGGTSIGLYACAFARALGAERVCYGADAVSTVEELDRRAVDTTEPGGLCHSAGIYFGAVDPMPVFSDRIGFDALPDALALLPEKPLVTHLRGARAEDLPDHADPPEEREGDDRRVLQEQQDGQVGRPRRGTRPATAGCARASARGCGRRSSGGSARAWRCAR